MNSKANTRTRSPGEMLGVQESPSAGRPAYSADQWDLSNRSPTLFCSVGLSRVVTLHSAAGSKRGRQSYRFTSRLILYSSRKKKKTYPFYTSLAIRSH